MTHTSSKAKKKKSLLEIMQRQMGEKGVTEQGFFTILYNHRECSFRQISQEE